MVSCTSLALLVLNREENPPNANLIPGIFIPINLLTVVISGFGGVPGVLLLILLSLIA